MLDPSFHLFGLVLNGIPSGSFQRGYLRLHRTIGLFYSIIHALQIACVSTDLYVIAQLKPKVICTTQTKLQPIERVRHDRGLVLNDFV